MNNNLEYRILTKKDAPSIIDFCRKENIYLQNNLIQNICLVNWEGISTDHIGYGCFDNGNLVGYIGCIQAKRNGIVFNDLSCGIVNEKYRGVGIASKLFDISQNDGDVILDLTASEQVYQMFKRKFPRFFDISDYQLWFNCWKLKTNDKLFGDFETVAFKENLDSNLKKVIEDNSRYSLNFAYFAYDNKKCLVAYYTMKKKKILKGFEICYFSNKDFFEEYYEGIIKRIAKKENAFFAFVDKRFLPNSEFNGTIMQRGTNTKQYIKRMTKLIFRKYVKAPNRKFIALNRDINSDTIRNIDYLYTEMSFYKNID